MYYIERSFARFSFEVGYIHAMVCHLPKQDKILEDQFYASCEQEEETNGQNSMIVRPRLFPQSAHKRQLVVADSSKFPSSKKATHKINNGSSSSGKGNPVGEDCIGLTLRVVPFDTGSSTSPSALPSLTKPLLRVSANTVSVDKIQRFIHKRMGVPSDFASDDIEILRDGVAQLASSSISHHPSVTCMTVTVGGIDTKPPSLSENVIILAYRKVVKLEKT